MTIMMRIIVIMMMMIEIMKLSNREKLGVFFVFVFEEKIKLKNENCFLQTSLGQKEEVNYFTHFLSFFFISLKPKVN